MGVSITPLNTSLSFNSLTFIIRSNTHIIFFYPTLTLLKIYFYSTIEAIKMYLTSAYSCKGRRFHIKFNSLIYIFKCKRGHKIGPKVCTYQYIKICWNVLNPRTFSHTAVTYNLIRWHLDDKTVPIVQRSTVE